MHPIAYTFSEKIIESIITDFNGKIIGLICHSISLWPNYPVNLLYNPLEKYQRNIR